MNIADETLDNPRVSATDRHDLKSRTEGSEHRQCGVPAVRRAPRNPAIARTGEQHPRSSQTAGDVLGQTVPRHTSAALVDFLGDIVARQPKGRAIHVIAGNCRRMTQGRRTFLLTHPNGPRHSPRHTRRG